MVLDLDELLSLFGSGRDVFQPLVHFLSFVVGVFPFWGDHDTRIGIFERLVLLPADLKSVSWILASSEAATNFVLRQCLFLVWSVVIAGLILTGRNCRRSANISRTGLPSTTMLWQLILYQGTAVVLNGFVLEMIPWGVQESSAIAAVICAFRFQVCLIFAIRYLIWLRNHRLLLVTPQRPTRVGRQRCSTKYFRARTIRWKGVMMICNLMCAQATPLLPSSQTVLDWWNAEASLPVPAYQSCGLFQTADGLSQPCGAPESNGVDDLHHEGFGATSEGTLFEDDVTGDNHSGTHRFCAEFPRELIEHRGLFPYERGNSFVCPLFGPMSCTSWSQGFCGPFPNMNSPLKRRYDKEGLKCSIAHSLSNCQEEEQDEQALMQRPLIRFVPDPLLGHVTGFNRASTIRVTTWLHTWDRRGTWSHIRQDIDIHGDELVHSQILRRWRTYQVRPTVTIVPIRPMPDFEPELKPSFLLLPVPVDSWIGFLAVVRTPFQYTVGTFLLSSRGTPQVSEIFAATLPGNQCVWTTECWAVIGIRVYQFFEPFPIFEGAFVRLHEALPAPSSANTTCSSGSEETDGSDDWSNTFSEPVHSDREQLSDDRDNTATRPISGQKGDEFGLMQQGIWRRPIQQSRLESVCISGEQEADVVRSAYCNSFGCSDEAIATLRTYLHHWSGTPVRTSFSIKAAPEQHLTARVLEEWRCPKNHRYTGFFVYPTPRRGLRGETIPVLLIRNAADDHLTTIYVELHAMPYTHASIQITPGATVSDLASLVLATGPAPEGALYARNMAEPSTLLLPEQKFWPRDGDFFVLFPKRQVQQCFSKNGRNDDLTDLSSMMQTTAYVAWNTFPRDGYSRFQAFWNEFDYILRTSQGSLVSLIFHGLRSKHVEARRMDMSWTERSDDVLVAKTRTLWRDYIGPRDDLNFYMVWPQVEDAGFRCEVHFVADLWPSLGGTPVLLQWNNLKFSRKMYYAFRGHDNFCFADVIRIQEEPWDRSVSTIYSCYTNRVQYALQTPIRPQQGQRLDIDYREGECIRAPQESLLTQGGNTATPEEREAPPLEEDFDGTTLVQLHLMASHELELHCLPYVEPDHGIVMINAEIAKDNDVLRTFVLAVAGPAPGPVWAIHTWMIMQPNDIVISMRQPFSIDMM